MRSDPICFDIVREPVLGDGLRARIATGNMRFRWLIGFTSCCFHRWPTAAPWPPSCPFFSPPWHAAWPDAPPPWPVASPPAKMQNAK